MSSSKLLLVIAGPTAVGKTSTGIALAQHFNTEIISADSRQVYAEMNIGTAKPSKEELGAIPHHLVGHVSIHKEYNAGIYENEGLACLNTLFEKHDIVVMVGGSGLYIDAVCSGFDPLPDVSPELRDQLKQTHAEQGIEALQKQLQSLDPEYYKQVDTQNPARLMRAIEVCLTSGKPYSQLRSEQAKQRPFNTIMLALNLPRETLYAQINKRVDKMLEQGLIKEAQALHPLKHLKALQTVGYSELFDHFDGKFALEDTINLIKQNTRRYAKRQLTWFRRYENIQWFTPNQIPEMIAHINTYYS